MALFSRFVRPLRRDAAPDAVAAERRKPRLPLMFRNLRVPCRNHVFHPTLEMRFSNFGVSRDGQPLAIYICPHYACRCRQAWTQHRVTGDPFRLWVRSSLRRTQ